mgnify:FL=1
MQAPCASETCEAEPQRCPCICGIKKKEQLRQAGYYFGVILAFAIGAGIGGVFSMLYGIHVIWISCGLLLVSFLLMSLEKYR